MEVAFDAPPRFVGRRDDASARRRKLFPRGTFIIDHAQHP
jgi:hypothetical protein